MSGFSKFVVAGAGGLGGHIVAELAAQPNVTVAVLSRAGSRSKKEYPSNVTVVPVDYSDETGLVAALSGHEVLISTLFGPGWAAQPNLAKASKAAGIKVFLPSEFGNPTDQLTSGTLYELKTKLHHYTESIGLPYTLVFTGAFPDFSISPEFGFDFPNNVSHPIPGTAPISWTTMKDIGRFLAHYLTHTTTPERIIRLEGDRKSFSEIPPLYEKSHPGVKINVNLKPVEEYKARFESDPNDLPAYLLLQWNEGAGSVGEPNHQALWPEWNPTNVEKALSTFP